MVSSDNREYYAISKDFNLYEAWNRYDLLKANTIKNQTSNDKKEYWIREKVLKSIFIELENLELKDINFNKNKRDFLDFTYNDLKYLIKKYCKSNKEIAEEIKNFVYEPYSKNMRLVNYFYGQEEAYKAYIEKNPNDYLKFYGYYSSYDWVVLCQLFGKMIDLPIGFPMYCIDLKQSLEETQVKWINLTKDERVNYCKEYSIENNIYSVDLDLKNLINYPRKINIHDALLDAKWNKELYKFLNTLKNSNG